MKVVVNGQETELKQDITVQEMLNELGYRTTMLVVERNLNIVQKNEYNTCKLEQDDKIEVVTFAGGG